MKVTLEFILFAMVAFLGCSQTPTEPAAGSVNDAHYILDSQGLWHGEVSVTIQNPTETPEVRYFQQDGQVLGDGYVTKDGNPTWEFNYSGLEDGSSYYVIAMSENTLPSSNKTLPLIKYHQ